MKSVKSTFGEIFFVETENKNEYKMYDVNDKYWGTIVTDHTPTPAEIETQIANNQKH